MKRSIVAAAAIAVLCVIQPVSAQAEPASGGGEAKEQGVQELLELSMGLGFSTALKQESPELARRGVNQVAFSYYLLCVGKGAVFPPNKNVESMLSFQRGKALADAELIDDPLQVGDSATTLGLKTDRQMSGKSYGLKTIADYRALVGEFHAWLKGLKK